MNKQIRHVPLDFDYPLNVVWEGFKNPFPGPNPCYTCNETGYNYTTLKVFNDYGDTQGYGFRWYYRYDSDGRKLVEKYPGACRRWMDRITQEEFDEYLKIEGNRYEDKKITLEEANRVCRWDSWDQRRLVEIRAKRLGVFGLCKYCDGQGSFWLTSLDKDNFENWQPYDPPHGPGWQVWETVSEGSPISPVFPTAEELIQYLVTEIGYTPEEAQSFCKTGFTLSAAIIRGVGWVENAQTAIYL